MGKDSPSKPDLSRVPQAAPDSFYRPVDPAIRQQMLRAMLSRARGGDVTGMQLPPQPPMMTPAPAAGGAQSGMGGNIGGLDAIMGPIRELLGRISPQFSGAMDQGMGDAAALRKRIMDAIQQRTGISM